MQRGPHDQRVLDEETFNDSMLVLPCVNPTNNGKLRVALVIVARAMGENRPF